MRQKTSLIVLSLLVSAEAIEIDQKTHDFSTNNLGNKISNLAFVMMNGQNGLEQRPDSVEMLQLDTQTQENLDKSLLDPEEITDLMKDTFAAKKEAEPTVGEILAEEENKEQDKDDSKKEEEAKPVEVTQEDTMSFTEQLELAKKQSEEEEVKAKKNKEDKQKKAKLKAEKDAKKKKQLEEDKKKKAKQDEDDLGDPFDEKANLSPAEEKQKNMMDEISRAEQSQGSKAPKDIDDVEDDNKEKQKETQKPKEKTEHFKDADEAMDSFGKRLAEHQLELSGGGPAEEEPKPEKKVEKKKETKKVDSDFDEDEMKAINKISMGDEKPKSFKEYQMEQVQEEMNEKEEDKPKQETKKSDLVHQILAKHKKTKASPQEPAPGEDTNVMKASNIHVEMPKLQKKITKKPVDLKSLIKAKNSIKKMKPAAAPKIEEKAEEQAPPTPQKKTISDKTKEKIQQQYKKDMLSQGEKGSSDITQALADSDAFGDVGDSDKEPSGFFGKYLKKHRDAKKKATDAVLLEEKETKQRLIEKMNEKIAEKKVEASPSMQLFQGTATPPPPKEIRKLTLSERTALKFTQEQQQQKDKSEASKGIALEFQSMTQIDDTQSTADEIVAQVFGGKQ